MKNIIAIIILLASNYIYSQNYNLDPSFGDGGIREFSNVQFSPVDVLLANNNYFFLGYNSVAKVQYDGTMDSSFGENGILLFNPYTFSGFKHIDNSIYLFGKTNNNNALILKIDEAGLLDTSFGTNGVANIDFGNEEVLSDFIIGQDGKLYCTGTKLDPNTVDSSRIIYFRLNNNGTLDTSFDPAGYKTHIANNRSKGTFIKKWGNDLLLIGIDFGQNNTILIYNPIILRLDASGNIITTFGTNGHKIINVGQPTAQLNQVEIVGNDLYINYFYSHSFTSQGSSFLKYNLATDQTIFDDLQSYNFYTAIAEDGIYLTSGNRCYPSPCNDDFVVKKKNFDNSIDTSFHNNGEYTYFLAYNQQSRVLLKEEGKILLGGYSSSWPFSKFMVLRIAEGPLGNEHHSKENINIYPNPFTDRITIHSPEIKDVTIFDISGRKVGRTEIIHRNGMTTVIPNIAEKGIYILKATTSEGRQIIQKIIKE